MYKLPGVVWELKLDLTINVRMNISARTKFTFEKTKGKTS
jgi:hypothetical protein